MTTSADYKSLEWQKATWYDKSLVMLLTGSAGGGKSRAAAEKVNGLMRRYPGSVAMIGRKDKTAAGKSVVPLLRDMVLDGVNSWGVYKKTDSIFEYNNGSRIYVVGFSDESQREQVRSIGKDGAVDFAWFEEANKLEEKDHNEILARMRANNAGWRQIIYTTNPDTPTHWINKRLIEKGEASVHYSAAIDNPYNPKEYIDTLNSLTGVQYKRLALGQWVQAEGAVYDGYDPKYHLVDWFEPPEDSRWIVGIDFGYTNPFVCSLWYLDNDDRMYLYRQIYMSKRIVEDHVPAIRDIIKGKHIEAWITDHDAEDRATLEKHLDITTTPAYKAVSPGIQAVQNRLVIQEDDKPRIFFMKNAVVELDLSMEEKRKPTSTVEEIPGYTWQNPTKAGLQKEVPVKKDDHGVDELRYVTAYVDEVGDESFHIMPEASTDNWMVEVPKEERKIGW